MINKENEKRLEAYRRFLCGAVQKRKESISAKDLAEKMDVVPASLYRMESGVNDVKVSTLLAYLDGFGFTIEIIPYEKQKKDYVDYVLTVNDEPVRIENNRSAETFKDRRTRLRVLQYLLKLEEEYLNGEKQ